MLNKDITITSPVTKKEFNNYYYFRWFYLRKEFSDNIALSKDELEDVSYHVMAMYKKKIIGVGRMHKIDNQISQIRYMAVDSSYQKIGVGSLILSHLIDAAISDKQDCIILHSREHAIDFYKKNNFKIVKKSHLLYGKIQHFLMKRELANI